MALCLRLFSDCLEKVIRQMEIEVICTFCTSYSCSYFIFIVFILEKIFQTEEFSLFDFICLLELVYNYIFQKIIDLDAHQDSLMKHEICMRLIVAISVKISNQIYLLTKCVKQDPMIQNKFESISYIIYFYFTFDQASHVYQTTWSAQIHVLNTLLKKSGLVIFH